MIGGVEGQSPDASASNAIVALASFYVGALERAKLDAARAQQLSASTAQATVALATACRDLVLAIDAADAASGADSDSKPVLEAWPKIVAIAAQLARYMPKAADER